MCELCVPFLHPRLISSFKIFKIRKKKSTWTEQLCFPSLSPSLDKTLLQRVAASIKRPRPAHSPSSLSFFFIIICIIQQTQQQFFSLLLSLSEPNQRRLRLRLYPPFINALLSLFLLYRSSLLSPSRPLFLFLSLLYNHPPPTQFSLALTQSFNFPLISSQTQTSTNSIHIHTLFNYHYYYLFPVASYLPTYVPTCQPTIKHTYLFKATPPLSQTRVHLTFFYPHNT